MNGDKVSSAISTANLSVGYDRGPIRNALLERLDLKLISGKLTCFMGPNGIGKSTLIRTLGGLQEPLSGEIRYDGIHRQHLADLPQHLAVVLTDRISAINMTVFEVVAFGRYPYLGWDVKLSEKDHQMIGNTLAEFHIDHLRSKKIHELSDGQMQMVMIARAVVQDTPSILLDEPTAHLDLNNRLEIMNLLRKLAHQFNKAILVSTHELDLALQTADIIWLAGHDKRIISGIPEDLILNGAFDSIFQFKGFDLKTGKVEHVPHRGITIHLTGSGHEYLWTKNALERNGFLIGSVTPAYRILVSQEKGALVWTIDDKNTFTSIEDLINCFA
jgi:iron complex transport system ATP-binding protein